MEISFQFSRPTRFTDMEGGTPIFAEPSEIADRYADAMQTYLDELHEITMQSGADYHRVIIDEPYRDVLANFLTRRATNRSVR